MRNTELGIRNGGSGFPVKNLNPERLNYWHYDNCAALTETTAVT